MLQAMAPTLIDLFAGCGGMTAGFTRDSGFRSVAAVEWELPAAATYAANFGEDHAHCIDIAEFRDVPKADVVIGGPPCQGFSNLGSKDADDPRNALWKEYMRVVLEANPQVFVLENVERFSKSPEFALLMEALNGGQLRKWKHYDARVLNAANYGVPQRRNRTIVIASRVGPIGLPDPTHDRESRDGRAPWATVRGAIGGLPEYPDTTELPDTRTTFYGTALPGTFKMGEIHFGRHPTPLSLDRYDHVPPGGGRFDLPAHMLPKCWANKPTGTTDVMGRMRWDAPSLTIRTEFFKPEKGQYLHPQWDADDPALRVNRVITHQEAALLQTFPKDFVWCGSKTDIARQIGNAVPPRLAEALANAVSARLK
jgi:DNA (cytosine-5)-methyltransferase 1